MKGREGGFLLIEILISALIIAGSISASFFLFRMGFDYWQRAEESNLLARKVPQVISYLSNVAELEKGEGELDLGEEIRLKWRAELVETSRPQVPLPEAGFISPYELYLYNVSFILEGRRTFREHQIKIFRYRMLFSPTSEDI